MPQLEKTYFLLLMGEQTGTVGQNVDGEISITNINTNVLLQKQTNGTSNVYRSYRRWIIPQVCTMEFLIPTREGP